VAQQAKDPHVNRFLHDADRLETLRCLAMGISCMTSPVLWTLAARSGARYANSLSGRLSPVCLSRLRVQEHHSSPGLDSVCYCLGNALSQFPSSSPRNKPIAPSSALLAVTSVGVSAPSSSAVTASPSLGQQQHPI
jgi:hypothetical protein